MRYNEAGWIARDVVRRAVRDEYRDKFFAEIGGKRLEDPFSLEPDRGAQLGLVQSLIEQALSLHRDDKSALEATKSEISQSSLGLGFGSGISGKLRYQDHLESTFAEKFFSRLWKGI